MVSAESGLGLAKASQGADMPECLLRASLVLKVEKGEATLRRRLQSYQESVAVAQQGCHRQVGNHSRWGLAAAVQMECLRQTIS